jgi:hypothetical protein
MLSETARSIARQALLQIDAAYWAREVLGVQLDPWQVDLLRATGEVVAVAARQTGKSFTASLAIAHLLTFRENGVAVSVSPSLRQSSEVVRKVRQALNMASVDLKTDNSFTLETGIGSRLIAVPGSEGSVSARGYSADLVLFDEASYLADDAVVAVRPMTATRAGAKIINISSSGVASGWFYRLWRDREQYPEVKFFDIRAEACPRISAEFLADERRRLGTQRYAAEYENQWIAGGVGFFGEALLAAIERRQPLDESPIPHDPQVAVEVAARASAAATLGGLLNRRRIPA